MSKKAMARIVLFTKTVKELLPKLLGFDYEITVGIKVLEPKKKGFKQYGTYIILGRKFITENSADDIYHKMIVSFQEVHKELDKNLKKHILTENGIPKPLRKIG